MRFSFAAALFGAILGIAPAAPAQAPARFVSTVGQAIPYRIDLPNNWKVSQERQQLTTSKGRAQAVHVLTASRGDAVVLLYSMDVMSTVDHQMPVSDAEARRMMTNMILDSDSLLYGMMREWNATPGGGRHLQDGLLEIRTFAGQKAGFMRGRITAGGGSAETEMHFTMKDGIAYFLFVAAERNFTKHEPLFARIRDSLVFAPAPQ